MPAHVIGADWLNNTALIVRPQLSVTDAAPGAVAKSGHATVVPPSAGALHTGGLTV